MTEAEPDGNTSTLRSIPWLRIASILGFVLLLLIVLPFIVYMVPQAVGADHSYVVLSGSMEPAISPGDVVIVGSVAPAEIQAGDVITFGDAESRPTTHRVVDVVQEDGGVAFRTKGDNNENADQQLVNPDDVIGQVMTIEGYLLVIPLIGRVILFASSQTGFVALLLVPFGLLVLNEVWNVVASTRSSTESSGAPQNEDGAPAEADATESSSSGITFTATELQLGIGIMTAFLAYSVWVAYVTLETWSIGVAGAVGTGLLLLLGLYFLGGSEAPDSSQGGGGGRPRPPADRTDPNSPQHGGEDPLADSPSQAESPSATTISDGSVTTAPRSSRRELLGAPGDSSARVSHTPRANRVPAEGESDD